MEANSHRPSAAILAFPAGGRKAASILSAQAKFAAEVRAIRKLTIAPETGWYHQDAIDGTAVTQKN
ncbi:MAG: DUF2735 domain-containing protein [Mesorhizobium sp.]|nr:DUF2735 domain-containing protein [Mesorhizobium sp.]MBL8578747.1 DUF2735 domain-containing protein [Mesorhizobium sp.]